MPENAGLYCVLFPMRLLLIPVFTATGNYTGSAAGASRHSRKGKRLGRGVFFFPLYFSLLFLLHFSSPPLSPLPPFPTFHPLPLFFLPNTRVKKKDLQKDTCVCVHMRSCVLVQAHPVVFSPTTPDKKCNSFLLFISALVLLCVDYAASKVCEMTELIQRLLLSPEVNSSAKGVAASSSALVFAIIDQTFAVRLNKYRFTYL